MFLNVLICREQKSVSFWRFNIFAATGSSSSSSTVVEAAGVFFILVFSKFYEKQLRRKQIRKFIDKKIPKSSVVHALEL